LRAPRYNLFSTLYPQSCWCIIRLTICTILNGTFILVYMIRLKFVMLIVHGKHLFHSHLIEFTSSKVLDIE
jgi:hypothetical protein